MADLVSGLYDLFAGDPAAKQKKEFDALSSFDTGTGEALTTAGSNYDLSLLSGDPSRIAATLAPEISAGQGMVEQQALQDANFGTRSGGTAAATEAAPAAERANIINLIGQTQAGAAGSALSSGSNLLSQATSNTGAAADLAEQRRKQTVGDVGDVAQGAAQIIGLLLGGGGDGGGGMDPGSFDNLISQGGVKQDELDQTVQPTDLQL